MPQYASRTEVSAEKSRGEIERILSRYGAAAFGYGWNEAGAIVTFEAHERRVQFTIPMPDRNDKTFTTYYRGSVAYRRSADAAEKAWEQATRQRWRALALVIKAKLEAVDAGISTFEVEFLPHTLVRGDDGRPATVAEVMLPQVAAMYESGQAPRLALPMTTGA